MPDTKRPLKVFLCHAHADKVKARELYRYLRRRGIQPWLDAENLLPGQNWQAEIPKALETSDAIIICLSKDSVDKEGYVQKEIKFALDKALEMPEGRIFLIPSRLEECNVPYSLSGYQWVDLFDEGGYEKLMKSLKLRAAQLQRSTVQTEKPEEPKPELHPKPELEQPKKISVHVDGNVQGNIVIGNENAVQSQAVQPQPEKPIEANPYIAEPKNEPRKPVSQPSPKKESAKLPRKLKTEYIVLGITIIIVTALFCVSAVIAPWILTNFLPKAATPVPVTSATPILSVLTMTPYNGKLDVEISDAKGVRMCLVPEGVFIMGSENGLPYEKPVHQVFLHTYYLDKFEVTNSLYKSCVDAGVCKLPGSSHYTDPNYTNHPVVAVDWFMAKSYCEWRGGRLPTEAEWEKAARGADGRTYPWGDNMNETYLNFNKPNGDSTLVGSYEVGRSPYGIYDMAGNVGEWVSSLFLPYPYNASDSRENWTATGTRVVRGGAYVDAAINVRSFHRYSTDPSSAYANIGFRCARSVP